MPRCFLSRFLALSDIDDEAIDDEASKDVSDDGTSESDDEITVNDDDDDDEALRDRRARILRRDFRLFFCCSDRCLNHCSNHLFSRVHMQFRNSRCIRLQNRFTSSLHT